MGANGDPNKVAMDKSGANKAAINAINAGRNVPILVREVKFLNNIVEQDHRAIKRLTKPMLNFKSFQSASSVLAGVELRHMIRKGQFAIDGADAQVVRRTILYAGRNGPSTLSGTMLCRGNPVV
jgi:putative transposase